MTYDVIVVGAGVPGLYAARELARNKQKVLIIDLSKAPGDPNYSTAGTPVETIKNFDLPKEGISATITRFIFATKHSEAIKDSKVPVSYVLNFRKMKSLLAKQVEKAGGKVRWGVSAQKFSQTAEGYELHTTAGIFKTKFLIDASGSTGRLAVQAGIREAVPSRLSVGMEYIVKAKLPKFQDALAIYLDTELCPHGYAWVFADGKNTYKVGLAEYYLDPARKLPSLDKRLDAFVDWLGREHIIKIEEKHGGSKYITTHFSAVRKDNLLAIGDVIGAINPIYGEGIRHGLYSAKFAVQAILQKNLDLYEQQWRAYLGDKWKKTEFQAQLLYKKRDKAAQDFYEALVASTQKHSTAQTILETGYYYTSKFSWRKLPETLRILWTAVKVML